MYEIESYKKFMSKQFHKKITFVFAVVWFQNRYMKFEILKSLKFFENGFKTDKRGLEAEKLMPKKL